MPILSPDRFFSRITDIDIQHDLLDLGIDCALLDIDNTVRSRATGDVPRDVAVWMGKARDAGVRFCLLSNNWHANVLEFAKDVDLPIVNKACKPLPHGYAIAMRKLKAKRRQCVAIGDQLLTDIAGAHIVGIPAYLVLPLAEVDLRHTLFLRNFERGIIGAREPESAPVAFQDGALRSSKLTETAREGAVQYVKISERGIR